MKTLTILAVLCICVCAVLEVSGDDVTKQNVLKNIAKKHINPHHHHHHHHPHHHRYHHSHHHHHKHHHHKLHHYKHHHFHKHHHNKLHHRHHHHRHHSHHLSFHQKLVLKLKEEKAKEENAQKYLLKNGSKQNKRDSLPQLLVSLGKGFMQLGTNLKKDESKHPVQPKATVIKQMKQVPTPTEMPTEAPVVATPTPTSPYHSEQDDADTTVDAQPTVWQPQPSSTPTQRDPALPPRIPKVKAKILKKVLLKKGLGFIITPTPPQPMAPTESATPPPRKITKAFPSPILIKKIAAKMRPKIIHKDKPIKIAVDKNADKISGKSSENDKGVIIPNPGVEVPPSKIVMVPSPTESTIDEPVQEQFSQPDIPVTFEDDSSPGANIFVNDISSKSPNNGNSIDQESDLNIQPQNVENIASPKNTNIDDSSSEPLPQNSTLPNIDSESISNSDTTASEKPSIDNSSNDLPNQDSPQNSASKSIDNGSTVQMNNPTTLTNDGAPPSIDSENPPKPNPPSFSTNSGSFPPQSIDNADSSQTSTSSAPVMTSRGTTQPVASPTIDDGNSESITKVNSPNVPVMTSDGIIQPSPASDSDNSASVTKVNNPNVPEMTSDGIVQPASTNNDSPSQATKLSNATVSSEDGIDHELNIDQQTEASSKSDAAQLPQVSNTANSQINGPNSAEHTEGNIFPAPDPSQDQSAKNFATKPQDELNAPTKIALTENDITPSTTPTEKTTADQHQEIKPIEEIVDNSVLKQNTTTDDESAAIATNITTDASDNEIIVDGEVSPATLSNNDNGFMDPTQPPTQRPTTFIPTTPTPTLAQHSIITSQPVTQEIEDGEVLPSQLQNGSLEFHGLNDTLEGAPHVSESKTISEVSHPNLTPHKAFPNTNDKLSLPGITSDTYGKTPDFANTAPQSLDTSTNTNDKIPMPEKNGKVSDLTGSVSQKHNIYDKAHRDEFSQNNAKTFTGHISTSANKAIQQESNVSPSEDISQDGNVVLKDDTSNQANGMFPHNETPSQQDNLNQNVINSNGDSSQEEKPSLNGHDVLKANSMQKDTNVNPNSLSQENVSIKAGIENTDKETVPKADDVPQYKTSGSINNVQLRDDSTYQYIKQSSDLTQNSNIASQDGTENKQSNQQSQNVLMNGSESSFNDNAINPQNVTIQSGDILLKDDNSQQLNNDLTPQNGNVFHPSTDIQNVDMPIKDDVSNKENDMTSQNTDSTLSSTTSNGDDNPNQASDITPQRIDSSEPYISAQNSDVSANNDGSQQNHIAVQVGASSAHELTSQNNELSIGKSQQPSKMIPQNRNGDMSQPDAVSNSNNVPLQDDSTGDASQQDDLSQIKTLPSKNNLNEKVTENGQVKMQGNQDVMTDQQAQISPDAGQNEFKPDLSTEGVTNVKQPAFGQTNVNNNMNTMTNNTSMQDDLSHNSMNNESPEFPN